AAVVITLAGLASSAAPVSRPARIMDAAEIRLALAKLQVVGSALYLAAHPDDENTAMIAWFSKEKLLRTGYLSLTRGDGGQNLIGSDKGPALGVIRTQELIAAREIDGGNQFFTRSIDFGYSKSPDETLSIWGREETLADVVFVIRKFRPDVIVTRFPTNGDGGHGQHTASAILAVEAFNAAGDPSRFPEQLKYVQPWQPKRVFWNDWRASQPDANVDTSAMVTIDLGAYSALLGRSFTEIAGAARSMHKSQGFGAPERRGSIANYLSILAGAPATSDPLEGVDTSWSRLKGGAAVATILAEAERSFDEKNPSAIVPILVRALGALENVEDRHWVDVKRTEILEVIRSATGLWFEAIASTPTATPGSKLALKATIVNRSPLPVRLVSVEPAWGGAKKELASDAPFNAPLSNDLEIVVPAVAKPSQPYWLERPPDPGHYHVDDASMIGLPEGDAPLSVRFRVAIAGRELDFTSPALYRWVDPVRGELYRQFAIEPRATASFHEPVYVFPDASPRQVRVAVRGAEENMALKVRLKAPAGWTIAPAEHDITLRRNGDESVVAFTVTPPKAKSDARVAIELENGDPLAALSRISVDYEHIPPQVWHVPAETRFVRDDLRRAGSRIGYVVGSGDDVPAALAQCGYEVVTLSDDDLAISDFAGLDAIVLGVRAFNTRPALGRKIDRLISWVERGGTMVVQYNTADRSLPDRIAPKPLKLSRGRVTVEEAPMTLLLPEHPLLTSPNKIAQADFEGWVQERGLYFAGERDAAFESPIASNDPGEEPLDGSLVALRHGKGLYVYTGLAFFRHLPAGVPGAYKLFLNLVASRSR
ncbi:MAG: PIG-L family deacetylase, partial [Acidobacteria bacterium]|nr:PIG-L family deacetylase [Acidobacteriota bacterium]